MGWGVVGGGAGGGEGGVEGERWEGGGGDWECRGCGWREEGGGVEMGRGREERKVREVGGGSQEGGRSGGGGEREKELERMGGNGHKRRRGLFWASSILLVFKPGTKGKTGFKGTAGRCEKSYAQGGYKTPKKENLQRGEKQDVKSRREIFSQGGAVVKSSWTSYNPAQREGICETSTVSGEKRENLGDGEREPSM